MPSLLRISDFLNRWQCFSVYGDNADDNKIPFEQVEKAEQDKQTAIVRAQGEVSIFIFIAFLPVQQPEDVYQRCMI